MTGDGETVAEKQAVEGVVVTGGLGAFGPALFTIGIPHHSVSQYEQALKADAYSVVAHGRSADIERARTTLHFAGPTQRYLHAEARPAAAIAA